MTNSKKQPKRTVRLKDSQYRPTAKEMREDITIDATPRQILRALMQPVKVEVER